MNTTSFEELNTFITKYQTDSTIASLTPTVCALTGVKEPDCCGAVELSAVVDQAVRLTGKEGGIEKALIFCPDAVGEDQRARFPELLDRVKKLAGFQYSCAAVMPSVTPVCYGSIFSGASPAVHGIQKYEKPVLTVETLFDVLAEAGKNVAIVAINNCSIDCIFRKRKVDYYSQRTDEGAFEITRELLASGRYDVIISYYTSYDHLSHRHGPWSKEAVDALIAQMENHREDVVVIFAGYPDKMEGFLDKNPGLRSRIAFHIPFEDYNEEELLQIAELTAKKSNMQFTDDAKIKLKDLFIENKKSTDFGNGRFVRNVFEKAKMEQANRLVNMNYSEVTNEVLSTLTASDIVIPEKTKPQQTCKIGF
jgi:predicted AlkP superfamily phosphohydrolase/phosphomutase